MINIQNLNVKLYYKEEGYEVTTVRSEHFASVELRIVNIHTKYVTRHYIPIYPTMTNTRLMMDKIGHAITGNWMSKYTPVVLDLKAVTSDLLGELLT